MNERIGVFLCNCGGGMKNIDFDTLGAKLGHVPGVTFVEPMSNLCLAEGRDRMISRIGEDNPDRVVVAGCSPEFQERLFRRALHEAGLNGQLLSMANIREQCSWVHDGDVTAKAVELVKMAVNRVRLLQPLEKEELPVRREVLVVGGGFSAIGAALELSRIGLPVTVVTREVSLDGSGEPQEDFHGCDINAMRSAVETDPGISVLTSARVVATRGEVGDFTVAITREGDETCGRYGAIVLATGYETGTCLAPGLNSRAENEPIGEASIVSQEQLSQMLRSPITVSRPGTIAFVFDFCDENSRFPTLATLSNALAAREKWESEVYVLCKDVKVDSEGAEHLYREARECGVVFLKCEDVPRITRANGRVTIEARDVYLGEETAVSCDLLVAEELRSPAGGTQTLSSLLGVRLDSRGFYQDENVHLYPVSSEKKGVFTIGECRGDLDVGRVLTDISSVVMSVCQLVSPGKIEAELERVHADPQKCVACLTCVRVCPHGAIRLSRVENGKEIAVISDLACDACGVCAAICPAKAIQFEGYRDDQILAQIEAIGEA